MDVTGINPIDVAKYAAIAMTVMILIFFIVTYFSRYRKFALEPGPWEIKANKFPFLLRTDQMAEHTQGSFTLSHYFFFEAVLNEARRPIAIWNWGVYNPLIAKSNATITAYYLAPQEELMLEFKTAPTGDEHKRVYIHVPNVVPRKWHHIALTVEGRTVDIYLNGEHAKSIQLPNVLSVSSSGIQLRGDSGILGKTCLWRITEKRLTETDVSSEYSSTSDTAGNPLIPEKYEINWKFDLTSLVCPGLPFCPEVIGDCKTYVNYDFA